MAKLIANISAGIPYFVVEQPYYLKKMPGNPWLGAVHDGTTTAWNKGFSVKHIPFLYRFRHNVNPTGIPLGKYGKNPLGKSLHWLEASNWEKFRLSLVNEEGRPVVILCGAVILVGTWHCSRVLYNHPEMSFFNIAMGTTKPFVQTFRSNHKHPMDKPVFRWFQRGPEFYTYDMWREFIRMDLVANDPFVTHVKEIGRGDELLLYNKDRQGEKGNLIPSVFQQKSSVWTPRGEEWHPLDPSSRKPPAVRPYIHESEVEGAAH